MLKSLLYNLPNKTKFGKQNLILLKNLNFTRQLLNYFNSSYSLINTQNPSPNFGSFKPTRLKYPLS